MDNPPREHDSFPTGISSHSYGQPLPRQEVGPPPNRSFITKGIPHPDGPQDFGDPHSDAPPLISKFHEGGVPSRVHRPQEILTYRILCHEDRVGSIIGKGGSIIKTVQQETGCEIKIMEGVADSEDRVIVVSGPAVGFHSLTLFRTNHAFFYLCLCHFRSCRGHSFGRADILPTLAAPR